MEIKARRYTAKLFEIDGMTFYKITEDGETRVIEKTPRTEAMLARFELYASNYASGQTNVKLGIENFALGLLSTGVGIWATAIGIGETPLTIASLETLTGVQVGKITFGLVATGVGWAGSGIHSIAIGISSEIQAHNNAESLFNELAPYDLIG